MHALGLNDASSEPLALVPLLLALDEALFQAASLQERA
jgi:hypothetical protein